MAVYFLNRWLMGYLSPDALGKYAADLEGEDDGEFILSYNILYIE